MSLRLSRAGNDNRRVQYKLHIALAVILTSCSQEPPSQIEIALSSQIVPAIASWSSSSKRTLDLGRILQGIKGEKVCFLPQYADVEERLHSSGMDVENIFVQDGTYVPENMTALAIVEGDTAYVVKFRTYGMNFAFKPRELCVDKDRSRLYKRYSLHPKLTSIWLTS